VAPLGLFRRAHNGLDCPQRLSPAFADDLAFLHADEPADLLTARLDELGGPLQDLPALVARKLRHDPGPLLGCSQGAVHIVQVRLRDRVNDGVIIGIQYLDFLGLVDPLSCHVHFHTDSLLNDPLWGW
jgi:hypothetical protein